MIQDLLQEEIFYEFRKEFTIFMTSERKYDAGGFS